MESSYIISSLKKAEKTKAPFQELNTPDPQQDLTLRPVELKDFQGQAIVRQRLEILIEASLKRGEPVGHSLFSGPPGLGKTTLAHIVAKAMGCNLIITSGPILEKAADLAGILTNLKKGDILFIDEIHRLSRTVEEYLYPAMEDFKLDLMIDSGPQARSIQLQLEPFTLIGATTRAGLLSEPLRTRFSFSCRLDYYDLATLAQIAERTGSFFGIFLEKEAAMKVAERSRGTPRICNQLVRWVRDCAQVKDKQRLASAFVEEALNLLGVNSLGLDELDLKILNFLVNVYEGKAVGIQALASAVGEEAHTIEEVHEPYLILKGLIQRTPRGRVATAKAFAIFQQTKDNAFFCGFS